MHTLQNRWIYEAGVLKYYGMRNRPNLFQNTLRVPKSVRVLFASLPKTLSPEEKRKLSGWLDAGIIVEDSRQKTTPETLEKAQFCTGCVANDFMIPGLEFNDAGLCPMCQSVDLTTTFTSVLPVKKTFEHAKNSRFDIALFYTGGKDSSYLLHYLSKVLKLRVLALTWEIPFMSDSARQSIEAAKLRCPNVEFVTRKISDDDLRRIYRDLYQRAGNTCACPSLAYIVFFPDLVAERVPYFVAGNEPAQMLNLYFNHFAPPLAFSNRVHRMLLGVTNLFRVLTLRPPLKSGQMQSLVTMKQLAYGDPWFKRWSSYDQEILTHILASFDTVPHLLDPLKRAIKKASRSGKVPAFVHIDMADIAEGEAYDWRYVKRVITESLGWVGPEVDKGLHTSCKIERCKDFTQFRRFYDMKSQMIPFSAIELSVASQARHTDKDQAMTEIRKHLGFCLEGVPECRFMHDYLEGENKA
ncbi:MAG: hypothetical protein EA374_07195 [Acholeplasmatales bacterium]|nr:MAG: hypothetical protein EA374_07195 [Acholeplasmatales bacterium]